MLPFTARIERAPFHRARSESTKGTWPLPPLLADFFSILLGFFRRAGCKFQSMNPPIFQWNIQRLIDQTMPIQQILP